MLAKKITRLQHPSVQHWTELRKNRAHRLASQTILIAGEHMVRECPLPIQALITVAPCNLPAKEKFLVSEEILKKITGLQHPDGFAAVVPLPEPQDVQNKQFVLILDQIQDPGNLGTLFRSALALGWEGILLTAGTVDPFNDKALRASQGAVLQIPYCWQTPPTFAKGTTIWVADPRGAPLAKVAPKPPLALLLSSEGGGLLPWSQALDHRITIPMHSGAESLNVASAGAILLYTLRQNV